MSAVKNSTEQRERSIAAELVGKERDELGRFPQKWSVETALERSKLYATRKEFRTKNKSAYAYLVRKKKTHLLKFEKEVKLHRVNYFDVICDIKKCKTRSELKEKYSASYAASFNHDLLKRVYDDHFGRGKTTRWWTNERAISEAKKYTQRSEFLRGSPGAYEYILKAGIQDKAFSHMERKNSDFDCVYFWVADQKIDGMFIAKVGVTSARLGKERIKSVSRKSGIKISSVYIMHTCRALHVERSIKERYKPAGLSGFNGCTEFLKLTGSELNRIIGEYKWTNKIQNHGLKVAKEE